ncbi:hypothetical protein VII00023_19104 [Vibrio ichthyoenteri ATCC 700023]|uniref:Uncharacterized protein n=1 Tax=Vibrio ichthyoenteri ATCC 700023 TaxID=870968 RepID=F9RZE1_9VIBR|nr:hypothetical protein [Vibrio ichthyoenteri]EGU45357.1 hypothetical protein VII00023_19104 [Vibrio ichthyoenteri ATCC 700023]
MRLLTAITLWLITCSAHADYSNLAWSIMDSKGQRVYDTDNVLKAAIEQDRFIPLRFDTQFKQAAPDLFKQIYVQGQFELDAFASQALVDGIQTLVGEFACATYRHYAREPEATSCNGKARDKTTKEAMPFQDGQFIKHRLEITTNSIHSNAPNRSYDIYLPSVQQAPLTLVWGAVHELGSFFVHNRKRNDTVLTIYIDGYRLNSDGERSQRISAKPEIVFVVLPKASKLGQQKSQNEAAKFALADADLIVPLY